MFAVLILESLHDDAISCLPERVEPFREKMAIPVSWLFKAFSIKRGIANQITGISYTSDLDWFVLDSRSRSALDEWRNAWLKMPLHFIMGIFEFDDMRDFMNWMDAVGKAVNEPELFYRLIDSRRL